MNKNSQAKQYIQQLKAKIQHLESEEISIEDVVEIECTIEAMKQNVFPEHEFDTRIFDDFRNPEEQLLLEKIIEKNPYAIGIADKHARIHRINKAFLELFGSAPPKEMSFFDDPTLLACEYAAEIEKAKQGIPAFIPELWYNPHKYFPEYPSKDVCVKSSIIPIHNDNDEISNYIVIHQDITEIKHAENALIQSEKKYKQIYENIQNVYYECNLNGIITEISPSSEISSGYKREELIGMNVLDIYSDVSQRADVLDILHREGVMKNYLIDINQKNGKKLKCLVNSRIVKDDAGIPTGIIGSLVDISERFRIEEALKESEEKFRDLFEKADDLICTLDFEGNITSVNSVAQEKLGWVWKTESERNILKYVTQESSNRIKEHIKMKLADYNDRSRYEVEAIAKNGQHFIFEVTSFLRRKNDKPCEIFGIARDITERKRIEEELSKTRERYQELFESTSDIIYTMDFQGNVTTINPAVEKVLGYKFDEISSWNMADYVSPETNKRATEFIYKKLAGNADHTTYEAEFLRKDGTYTVFEINSFLRFKDGKPSEVFGIARDISERKKMEEELKLSEEKYKMIFENAPLGIMIADNHGDVIEINPTLLQMLGSSSLEETKKINILKYPPLVKSGVVENFKQCMKNGESMCSEHEYISKWGKQLTSRVYTKPICNNDDIIQGFQVIIEDITEEKVAEKLLTNSVLEKEALLREVHHRVKNNMQIIISLINMQIMDIEEDRYKQKFMELQQRVRTMSIIHEDLYMSKDLAHVNFGNYIQRLTVNLKQIYHNADKVDLHFSLNDNSLEIDTAIPLGLVINELVSNSFKHAFPDEFIANKSVQKFSISVEFTADEKEYKVIVADNGIGFSIENINKEMETLGLSLVQILVSQLHGQYSHTNKQGTRYDIRIPFKQ